MEKGWVGPGSKSMLKSVSMSSCSGWWMVAFESREAGADAGCFLFAFA
jgi:hypothetical protein